MGALLQRVLSRFFPEGSVQSCSRYGCGHINETYLVETGNGKRYILQRISSRAFPDVAGLQENIAAVTRYLHGILENPNAALTLVPTLDGENWYHHGPDSDWRVFDFIEGSVCLQAPRCPEDLYQSAIAFGTFQQQLSGFPAETLHETIRNFHNTPDRFRIFRETIARDPMGRAASVEQEIAFALAHEEVGSRLTEMLQAGVLPLRVTHNDTKLNNVMLDEKTHAPLCVIDLDTTMPGLSAYDFGDSIRFGAATAAEDEKDLSKMEMDLELFRVFTRGFLRACPALTAAERKALPLGALTMTLECGVRFLTDYLDGDHYFGISYPEQNLDRCRTQFKLVADMENKWKQMEQIVEEETWTMEKPVLVVMAAGMGSRYGGLKQIDPVGSQGEAILDYSLYDAHEAGFERAVIIIKEAIRKDFMDTVGARLKNAPMEIRYAYQELSKLPQGYAVPEGRTKPWGTCHAVCCALEEIGNAPFAVINADDYYGKAAFREIYNYLSTHGDDDKYRYCMVGYELGKTVTDNGSVARGVCRVNGKGFLDAVIERTRIEKYPGGIHYTEDGGESWVDVDEKATVSMNMWGFTPSFGRESRARFPAFLDQALEQNPLKGEYFLPSTVTALLTEGKATVQMLYSPDKWHGVTYAADKPVVVQALADMTREGLYPDGLWK